LKTRREQVQAHRFVTRRIVSAMLMGEPESAELPMRRLAMVMLGSTLVAAIVFAGIGVYGLLNPGGARPAENTLLIERETGAKYLYLQGTLHPVLNYTSARLILADDNPPVKTMSANSLRDLARGLPVGIPSAPDTLPGKAALLGLPWSVCSAPRSASSVDAVTQVFAGQAPQDGSALAGEGLLVSAGDSGLFLIWGEHRLRVRDATVLAALEWTSVQPVRVGEAFLNVLPPGPDLAALTPPGAGQPAQITVAGQAAAIGQVYRAGGQYYVMLSGGLSPVGEVMSKLMLSGGARVTEISAQQAGGSLAEAKAEPAGFPTRVPLLRAGSRAVMLCAGLRSSPGLVVETYGQSLPLSAQALPGVAGADGVITADQVTLPGGHAAVVSAQQGAGAGNIYLVTDLGVKYPLPRAKAEEVLGSLGYAGVRPVEVPMSILSLIPTAAALDPEVAARFSPVPVVSGDRPGLK
jgi:type VII secretion protein EccB